ncbi:SDR family NAD(P)-dependent oxidoreductase [Salinibacterium sp. dk5596]|uniref:SDR family NAD(P)-dependent oxidoreductase n=1 Tax=unclassified Salinibacterium TaxID=2632331 RepID=UPI00351AA578
MSGKTIIITGASDGIGAAAARELSRRGHRVVIVGRSREKTERIAAELDAPFYLADFARLSEVRELAVALARDFPHIDVLANNAGGIFGTRERTEDGFEKTFQVNHLAPFLLTNLLMPTLIASRASVINTSSAAAKLFARLDLDDLNNDRGASANRAYGNAKLANILFTRELNLRFNGEGISTAAFHPGVVATSFASDTTSPMRLVYGTPLRHLLRLITPEEGASGLVALAEGQPGVDWISGEFYEHQRIAKTNPQAYDAEAARRLWEESERMLGLTASPEPASHKHDGRFDPPCGPVIGRLDGAVIRATGIPYARAARFAPPAPVADWAEPLQATAPAPACPQLPSLALADAMGTGQSFIDDSEDCQNVSVTVPADLRPGESLPVMVFIHGGSYVIGAADIPMHDPAALVAEQRVIVVGVTYRLGLFGFLATPDGHPANLGLLDQIEAFRWVQRNIAAFGGDPQRVTAFGQSAGADAIAHIMATPDAPRLFSRAILQSAPLGIGRGRQAMNEAMGAAAAGLTAESTVGAVLARQARVSAIGGSFGLVGGMPFGPQPGHVPLPAEHELDAALDAAAPHIEVLIGHTSQESRLFAPQVEKVQRLAKVPVLGRPAVGAIDSVLTRIIYGAASRRFARRHAAAGGRARHYVFSWSAPDNDFGAAHTIDLPFLFGNEETWKRSKILAGAPWAEVERHARQVRQLWADFARGVDLPERGEIPGVLTHARVGSRL